MKIKAILALCALLLMTGGLFAREKSETGSIKGKVRVESGAAVAGVTVTAERSERAEGQTVTDRKGEFVLAGLAPGIYKLTFRKPGLSVGTIENVEVRAGKVRSLSDRLIMTIDEGTTAFLRGSVFNPDGLSVRGVRVKLERIEADNTVKRLDGRLTDESGSFVFRLSPERRRYRVSVKMDDKQVVAREVEVDGASVYHRAVAAARE